VEVKPATFETARLRCLSRGGRFGEGDGNIGWPCLRRHLENGPFTGADVRKILSVPRQQRWHIIRQDVGFAFNVLRLAGLEAADAEVGVEAAGDALEEFRVGVECDGEELLLIAAVAADEAVAGHQQAERARVHVGAWHVLGTPDLAGDVAGFFDPRFDVVHACELAFKEEEALGQVVVDVLALVVTAGEVAEADARLRPMRAGRGRGGIVRGDGKGDIGGAGGDGVIDNDAAFDGAAQLHGLLVLAQREEFRRVADGGVMPVGDGGVGAAIRFQAVDTNLALHQMRASNDEPVLVACERQVGCLREGEASGEKA
jgi:hypothetical protein